METIQQHTKVHYGLRPSKGRRRNPAPKAGMRSGSIAPHDFLKTRFPPIIIDPAVLENWPETERHFLTTLRHMEEQYSLSRTPISAQPFPLNVFETFRAVSERFKDKHYFEKVFLIQNGKFPYSVATAKPMCTGHNLYYLPFDQFIKLRRSKKHRPALRLILCACAYLYQKAGMPSYSKNDFMTGCYEMLSEWANGEEQDWEPEVSSRAISELSAADHYKVKMHRTLSNSRHLSHWGLAIASYAKQANPGDPLAELSGKFFALYQKYPERKVYDHRLGQYWPLHEDNLMEMDQYISFVWSNDGWIGDETFTYVNDNAGNYQWVDEPLQFTSFDTPAGRPVNDLEFEKCLLDYINQLATILNELCHDTI